MGDILNELTQNIIYDDVDHDWSTRDGSKPSVEEFLASEQMTNGGQFLENGYKLIAQAYPFKGIRYGGPSHLDQKFPLFNALNMALEEATTDKAQANLDKLVEQTFYGNGSDESAGGSNSACGSAGAEGVFDGEFWMGEIKIEWIEKTSAKPITKYGDYSVQIFNTINKYAPMYKTAPARVLAQLMMEGGHTEYARDHGNSGGGTTGAKGIGQFLKGSWDAPYKRAVAAHPELKQYDSSWNAHSTKGGPGHPVLGPVVMMEYMEHIHMQVEKIPSLKGKDEDYWWSTIGYMVGPSVPKMISDKVGADRTKADEVYRQYGGSSFYRKKGIQFYGDGAIKKWGEYSKAVPKSEKDQSTEADEPETPVSNCSAEGGDASSKIKWTPGQELGDIKLSDVDYAGADLYIKGIKGNTGKEWMKGKGKEGCQIEMDKAMTAMEAEMKKKGIKTFPWVSPFRTYQRQQEIYVNDGYHAKAGNSVHGTGYAIDYGPMIKNNKNAHASLKWIRENGSRWGIIIPLWDAPHTETWHLQLHPDLAYSLKEAWEARGKKFD